MRICPTQAATAVRSTRSRRGQRGAALVEAAFMLPMFLILFFGSLFANNLGLAYINMSQTSRANAWAFAMANCGNASKTGASELENEPPVVTGGAGQATKVSPMPDNPSATVPGLSSIPGVGSMLSGLSGTIASTVDKIFPNPDGSTATNSLNLKWREPNNYKKTDDGGTTTVTRTVTVFCNNRGEDGGAWNTIKLIGKTIADFL